MHIKWRRPDSVQTLVHRDVFMIVWCVRLDAQHWRCPYLNRVKLVQYTFNFKHENIVWASSPCTKKIFSQVREWKRFRTFWFTLRYIYTNIQIVLIKKSIIEERCVTYDNFPHFYKKDLRHPSSQKYTPHLSPQENPSELNLSPLAWPSSHC